jgi:cell division transport system permease protein
VLNELKGELKEKNFNLLKIMLPKFYRIYFTHYPTPNELQQLQKRLLEHKTISKVETFSNSHDTVYNLLLLFKSVTIVLGLAIGIITILLIFKELRIWQFQHNERMQIMALFGAPMWLRSAVLFRLAIVDAIIASALVFIAFITLEDSGLVNDKLHLLNIQIELFNILDDGIKVIVLAFTLAISLAFMVMMSSTKNND